MVRLYLRNLGCDKGTTQVVPLASGCRCVEHSRGLHHAPPAAVGAREPLQRLLGAPDQGSRTRKPEGSSTTWVGAGATQFAAPNVCTWKWRSLRAWLLWRWWFQTCKPHLTNKAFLAGCLLYSRCRCPCLWCRKGAAVSHATALPLPLR